MHNCSTQAQLRRLRAQLFELILTPTSPTGESSGGLEGNFGLAGRFPAPEE